MSKLFKNSLFQFSNWVMEEVKVVKPEDDKTEPAEVLSGTDANQKPEDKSATDIAETTIDSIVPIEEQVNEPVEDVTSTEMFNLGIQKANLRNYVNTLALEINTQIGYLKRIQTNGLTAELLEILKKKGIISNRTLKLSQVVAGRETFYMIISKFIKTKLDTPTKKSMIAFLEEELPEELKDDEDKKEEETSTAPAETTPAEVPPVVETPADPAPAPVEPSPMPEAPAEGGGDGASIEVEVKASVAEEVLRANITSLKVIHKHLKTMVYPKK